MFSVRSRVTYWWNKNWRSVELRGTLSSETLPANPLTTAVTTTYQVYACNVSECASFAPVTATVPGTSGTGGVIGGSPCPGFSKTMFYNWNWASGAFNINTSLDAQGPIGPNGVVVIAFTLPATAPFGGLGSVQVSPYPGDLQSTTRTTSISTTQCDFTPQADPTFVRSGTMPEPGSLSAPTLGPGCLPRWWQDGSITSTSPVAMPRAIRPAKVPGAHVTFVSRQPRRDRRPATFMRY